MVDIGQLAGDAVALVASHCRRLAGQLVDEAVDAAAERVYDVVERHLNGNVVGQAVLSSLRERPDDQKQMTALEAILRQAVGDDERFAEELRRGVGGTPQERDATGAPSTTAKDNALAVGTMNRSQVAFGQMTVDKSRRTQISIGVAGLAALVTVVVVLATTSRDDRDPFSGDRPGGGTAGEPTDGAGSPATFDSELTLAELAARGTVALTQCESTADITTLTISGVSADDGESRGTLQITVPGMDTLVAGPCGGPIRRHRFNEDFSQLAVLLRGPNGEGRRAAAVEIPSGEVVGPSPDPDEFATSPSHRSPTLDSRTGELWYIDSTTDRVVSRPVEAAPTEAVDHGPASENGTLTVARGAFWLSSEIGTSAMTVNPSGTHAVALDDVVGMTLRAQGNEDEVAFPGQQDNLDILPELSGQEVPYGCEPVFWTDDHTVVCKGSQYHDDTDFTERNYFQVTLSGDYTTVSGIRPLLPPTDRPVGAAVLSPNGDAFVFESTQGEVRSLYRQSLTSGAQPTKIVDLASGQGLLAWN